MCEYVTFKIITKNIMQIIKNRKLVTSSILAVVVELLSSLIFSNGFQRLQRSMLISWFTNLYYKKY